MKSASAAFPVGRNMPRMPMISQTIRPAIGMAINRAR
jgi:hypothetical protein